MLTAKNNEKEWDYVHKATRLAQIEKPAQLLAIFAGTQTDDYMRLLDGLGLPGAAGYRARPLLLGKVAMLRQRRLVHALE